MGPGDMNDRPPHAGEPSSADILSEAQRRLQERANERLHQPIPPRQRAWVDTLNRGVFWMARHWLAVFNTLAGLFIGGALLPPVFLTLGMTRAANILYALYRPLCHQYPFRSWFLFGPQLAYPLTEPLHASEMNALRSFVGDAGTGYKTALCQRDVAIYGFMFLAGLVFAVLRRRKALQPWPMWQYFAFGILPMIIDGGLQWLSYAVWLFFPALMPIPFETTPLMRGLTGALFGLGLVAVAYPHLDHYFEDVRRVLHQKYNAPIPSPEVNV